MFGILTQPAVINQAEFQVARPSDLSMSYIFKMYNQMLTAAGSMTMAIPYDLPMRKLNEILPYLRGILIPDGFKGSQRDDEYSQRVSFILNWARVFNENGNYFAVIAIGKGFQEMMIAMNERDPSILLCGYQNYKVHSALQLDAESLERSSLFKFLDPSTMEHTLKNRPGAPFNHDCAISIDMFRASPQLSSEFILLGTASKTDKPDFVALVEHAQYPFIGMQFNPVTSIFSMEPGHFKDRTSIRFFSQIFTKVIFTDLKEPLKKIDDLPMSIQNLLMYKDVPILGYHNSGQLYIYRRWSSGRDIDLPK